MSRNVVIKDAVKTYGNFNAVDHANLEIESGELFTLLGPSGCGKTTLLRMIAGFNSVDGGSISFGDKVINNVPAHMRNIGMVFQNYAIFPHMSVFDNVAYGLKARKVKKEEIEKRVMEALAMVQIEKLRDRQPANMSGGQQQRVALARAIVIHPDILLMDEPLSNLDAKLRIQMRATMKKLGITTIYVTHDQEEALAISDRIAVMKNGVIQQVGKPREIYTRPANEFVANFIGTSNFISGRVIENEHGMAKLSVLDKTEIMMPLKNGVTGNVKLSVRPEEFLIGTDTGKGLCGEIVFLTFLGDFVNYEVQLSNGQIVEVNQYGNDRDIEYGLGDKVSLELQQDKINVYSESGEEAVIEWKK